MTTAKLNMVFRGPAVEDGSINAEHLGRSIIAIAHLFREANRSLNGDTANVTVEVNALSPSASFVVDLAVVQDVATPMVVALGASEIRDIVLEGLSIWKLLKGRTPKTEPQTGGRVRVLNIEGDRTYSAEAVGLTDSKDVQAAARDLVAPLTGGVETVSLCEDGEKDKALELTQQDAAAVAATPVPEDSALVPVSATVAARRLGIVNLTFKPDNLWRLTDDGREIQVRILDPVFLGKVERREISFVNGDILEAKLVTRQMPSGRPEYEALDVTHVSPPQLPLDMPDAEP